MAITTSSGQLILYQLEKSKFVQKDVIKVNEEQNPVVLSLDWNNRSFENAENNLNRLLTSDSSGRISIFSVEGFKSSFYIRIPTFVFALKQK